MAANHSTMTVLGQQSSRANPPRSSRGSAPGNLSQLPALKYQFRPSKPRSLTELSADKYKQLILSMKQAKQKDDEIIKNYNPATVHSQLRLSMAQLGQMQQQGAHLLDKVALQPAAMQEAS